MDLLYREWNQEEYIAALKKASIAEGMEKGKAEALQDKLNSAKAMLLDNFEPEAIIKYTGLSLEQVRKLQELQAH